MDSRRDEAIGRDAIAAWVRRLHLRSPLDDDERAALLELPFEVERVASNRDFVRLGECVTRACLVAEGWCGRFGQTGDGDRLITNVYLPGDMVDLQSVVAPLATGPLQALSPTTIVRVPHRPLKQVSDRHAMIARAFWREGVADGLMMAEHMLNVGRRPALTRLAHLLCELTMRAIAAGTASGRCLPFPMTQAHLGDATALTPVHVNRMVRDLRIGGLATVGGRSIEIHNWRGLTDAGDFRPDFLHFDDEVVAGIEAVLTTA